MVPLTLTLWFLYMKKCVVSSREKYIPISNEKVGNHSNTFIVKIFVFLAYFACDYQQVVQDYKENHRLHKNACNFFFSLMCNGMTFSMLLAKHKI